jgi:hypothetical protein
MPIFRANGAGTPRQVPAIPFEAFSMAGIGGEFQFNGLSEGQFRLSPEKPGFMADFASNKPIKLTSSVTDIHLKLSPFGVIEGKVVDQYGEPVRRVNVIAVRARIDDGRRITSSDRSVATDDLGMYRLWNLQPGKYYIKAAGKSGGTNTYVGDNGPAYDSWESFAPVYSGGAHDLDSATPLEIAYGAQAQADITLALEPAVKIRGALGNFIPHLTAKFELLHGGEDVSASRVALNGTTGRFEIQDVTPGTYTLRVTQNEKTRAETTVTVNGRDVNDVGLALAPGVNVKAIIRTAGAPAPAPPPKEDDDQRQGFGDYRAASCNMTLLPSGPSSEHATMATADSSGDLNMEDVLPGEYLVTLQCFGGYASSATAGGIDLLTNPRLMVQPGVAPPRIEIMLMKGGGTLKGKLELDPPPAHPAILLVPAFSASTGPIMQRLVSMPDSKDEMRFQISSLAPGDYTVYAFSQPDQVEFRNPMFLQSLSGGTHVKIDPSGEQDVTLTSVVK